MRGTFEEPPTGLIPWFSKTEGNTYATIVASPFPLQGKPTQAQDVADIDWKSKDTNKSRLKAYMIKDRPGGHRFH